MFNILTYKQTEELKEILERLDRTVGTRFANLNNNIGCNAQVLDEIKSEIRNMNAKMHTLLPKDVIMVDASIPPQPVKPKPTTQDLVDDIMIKHAGGVVRNKHQHMIFDRKPKAKKKS